MSRAKGGKNKYWSAEEKLKIVKRVVHEYLSIGQVAKEEDIAKGMLGNWVIAYQKYGEKGLQNQKKPGNPLVKFCNRKELNELEQLQYENMKLKIENERLKKGYLVKGGGKSKEYIFLKKENLK